MSKISVMFWKVGNKRWYCLVCNLNVDQSTHAVLIKDQMTKQELMPGEIKPNTNTIIVLKGKFDGAGISSTKETIAVYVCHMCQMLLLHKILVYSMCKPHL